MTIMFPLNNVLVNSNKIILTEIKIISEEVMDLLTALSDLTQITSLEVGTIITIEVDSTITTTEEVNLDNGVLTLLIQMVDLMRMIHKVTIDLLDLSDQDNMMNALAEMVMIREMHINLVVEEEM